MIDPRKPDYTNTPVSRNRPSFGYAPKEIGKPVVSIITPFYNTGEVFHETALSVLGQSLQQFEWIIVNDGTKDAGSLAILEPYRHHADKRIRVIDHEVNRGLSASRNTGFAAAVTDYVLQIDSDDLLEPTAAEKMYWFLESHPEYGFVKGYTVGFGAQEYLWEKGFEQDRDFLEENQVDATAMIRKKVHGAVGGYDETSRDGLEDWDFWLRCAAKGYWGKTIPEFLDWYRRREDHGEQWKAWNPTATAAYREGLRKRYPELWNNDGWVKKAQAEAPSEIHLDSSLNCANLIEKKCRRIIFIIPWLTLGGADVFNLNLIRQLRSRGWEVSIVTTTPGDHSWLQEFTALTPDVFPTWNFVNPFELPNFLRYIIGSRQPDVLFISNSEVAYSLLPFLRYEFPKLPIVDYLHAEEPWREGGYPRISAVYRHCIDRHLVTSVHLKEWMVNHGAESSKIEVCYIGIDVERWRPNLDVKKRVRLEYNIDLKTPVILFAGRFAPEKRPQVVVKTLHRLALRGILFRGILCGAGPEWEDTKRLVQQNRLEHAIALLDAVPPGDVLKLMQASDIFFLPSMREGIAQTLYEALACGLIFVGADVGGQKEVATPEAATLITPKSDAEDEMRYAEILFSLLQFPDTISARAEKALDLVRSKFSVSKMGDKVQEILDAVVVGKAASDGPNRSMNEFSARVSLELYAAKTTGNVAYRYLGEFAEGKKWLDRQYVVYRDLHSHAEQTIVELRSHIAEMENGKEWLELQLRDKVQRVDVLEKYISELLAGKQWFEDRLKQTKFEAEQKAELLLIWEQALWSRIGVSLRALPSEILRRADD